LLAADARVLLRQEWGSSEGEGRQRVCIPIAEPTLRTQQRAQKALVPGAGKSGGPGLKGRIRVRKRRNGLDRCRQKGYVGMNCWVGLGVIVDNVVNIGRAMEGQVAR
jgi:IS5 family transposase